MKRQSCSSKDAAATDQSLSHLTSVTAVQMNEYSYFVYF